MSYELKPCPFCGSNNLAEGNHSPFVICDDCGAFGPGNADLTHDEAVEKWNTRYHSAYEETVIKAWEEIKEYTERTCKRKAYISMPRHNGERFAKLMVGEFEQMNAMVDNVSKSRWAELFGTPERAARTICQQLKHFNICICDGCPVKPPNKECDSEYDALLEWLRGDA